MIVALLSSKRLISAPAGAILESSRSSIEPRVTEIVLPASSSTLVALMSSGPKTPLKKGA